MRWGSYNLHLTGAWNQEKNDIDNGYERIAAAEHNISLYVLPKRSKIILNIEEIDKHDMEVINFVPDLTNVTIKLSNQNFT